MSKYKIINTFDKLFISVTIFLILYAWINFFIRDLWTTFFLSLVFTFGIVFILFYVLNRKDKKKHISENYKKDVEEKFLSFRIMNKFDRLNLVKILFSKYCEHKKVKDSLVCKKEDSKVQIFIFLEKEKLTQFDLINLISNREISASKIKIICEDFEPNLNTKILTNLEIEIVNKKKLYDEYFLPQNLFPVCSNLNTKVERKNFKEILKNFFVPQKAKSYFLCGLILIFSSIILPYQTYYLIFGTALLIFSVLCKLQPLFKH